MSNEQLARSEPEPELEQIPQTTALHGFPPAMQGHIRADSFLFQSWQDQSPDIRPMNRKGFGKPEVQLMFRKHGEITDLAGALWDVREIRPTKTGFDIYYRTPTSHRGGFLGGKPRLIATIGPMELRDANCTRSDGFLSLPRPGRDKIPRNETIGSTSRKQ